MSDQLPIALGLTLLEQTESMVALRWIELLRASPWFGPVYNGKGQYTVQARNIVLEQAFAEPERWPGGLLFWDADQLPPLRIPGPLATDPSWTGGYFTEYISHISQKMPTATVGGLYYSRITQFQYDAEGKVVSPLPHEAIAYNRNDDGTYGHLQLDRLGPMLNARGLHRVDGVGTGCMLIPQATLMRLRDLKHPEAIFEAPTLKAGQHGGLGGRQWTEDLYLCHEITTRLEPPLNEIWLDTAMESAHLAKVPITTQHHLASRGVFNQRNPILDQKPAVKLWTPRELDKA